MQGVIVILSLLAIFTTVGVLFAWMVRLMSNSQVNQAKPIMLPPLSEPTQTEQSAM